MLWRERRWRELLTLIDWLPRNTAYMEAISNDDEMAEQVLRQPESQQRGSRRPRISEWSAEMEKLTDLVDRMGEVMQAVVASAGGKPPKVHPQPRPKTAVDRLREKKRYEHHRKVVSRVVIQNPDGTTRPVTIGPPTKKSAAPAAAPPGRPLILPGEDPFRLRTTSRRPPPDGRATGEPIPPR